MKLFGQEINNELLNLSEFQISRINEIENNPNFDHFVVGSLTEFRKRGVYNVLWYDRSGKLNCERIGKVKILQTAKSD